MVICIKISGLYYDDILNLQLNMATEGNKIRLVDHFKIKMYENVSINIGSILFCLRNRQHLFEFFFVFVILLIYKVGWRNSLSSLDVTRYCQIIIIHLFNISTPDAQQLMRRVSIYMMSIILVDGPDNVFINQDNVLPCHRTCRLLIPWRPMPW